MILKWWQVDLKYICIQQDTPCIRQRPDTESQRGDQRSLAFLQGVLMMVYIGMYLRCIWGVPGVHPWCTQFIWGVSKVHSVYLRCRDVQGLRKTILKGHIGCFKKSHLLILNYGSTLDIGNILILIHGPTLNRNFIYIIAQPQIVALGA